jgi:hypothetical protein
VGGGFGIINNGGNVALNGGDSFGAVGGSIELTAGSGVTSSGNISVRLLWNTSQTFTVQKPGSTSVFTVRGTGDVIIGDGSDLVTATTGFLYIPTSSGPPTGVPVSYAGRVPLVLDTSSNTLYVYNGGWVAV